MGTQADRNLQQMVLLLSPVCLSTREGYENLQHCKKPLRSGLIHGCVGISDEALVNRFCIPEGAGDGDSERKGCI